jgi:hypothetical protein
MDINYINKQKRWNIWVGVILLMIVAGAGFLAFWSTQLIIIPYLQEITTVDNVKYDMNQKGEMIKQIVGQKTIFEVSKHGGFIFAVIIFMSSFICLLTTAIMSFYKRNSPDTLLGEMGVYSKGVFVSQIQEDIERHKAKIAKGIQEEKDMEKFKNTRR